MDRSRPEKGLRALLRALLDALTQPPIPVPHARFTYYPEGEQWTK